jgi:hypothetical protein
MKWKVMALGLGLMLAGGANAQSLEIRWDVPGLVTAVEMPGAVVSQGIPVKIRAAHSSWRVENLAQYYMDQFQKAGLYVPPDNAVTQMTVHPQLTGLDPDRMIAYTVIFQVHPDKTTTVIQTSANLALRQSAAAAAVSFAPVFPGAKDTLQTAIEGTRMVQYLAPAQPGEVLEFYRSTLKTGGYAEQEQGDFQKGTELLRVRAIKLENGQTSVSVTQLTGVRPLEVGP